MPYSCRGDTCFFFVLRQSNCPPSLHPRSSLVVLHLWGFVVQVHTTFTDDPPLLCKEWDPACTLSPCHLRSCLTMAAVLKCTSTQIGERRPCVLVLLVSDLFTYWCASMQHKAFCQICVGARNSLYLSYCTLNIRVTEDLQRVVHSSVSINHPTRPGCQPNNMGSGYDTSANISTFILSSKTRRTAEPYSQVTVYMKHDILFNIQWSGCDKEKNARVLQKTTC